MNIIQVPRRFVRSEWGGTETVILETGKCLLKKGYHTEIICSKALADEDSDTMEGVKIRRVSYFYPYWGLSRSARRRLDKKGGNLFSFELMRLLLKTPAIDLIHLHTMKRIGGICRYVAGKKGIPYIVSLHGGVYDVPPEESESWTAPTKNAFEWGKLLGWWVGSRRVLEDAAAIICVGLKEKEEIEKRFPGKRVIHLPNGVDTKRFSKGNGANFRKKYDIDLEDTVILTVGRIDPQKNQLFIIRNIPELLKVYPDFHFVFIGSVTNEEYAGSIETEIASRNLKNNVTIIYGVNANSNELVDAYHAANLFLLPSIHEPFGIVILEAWAAGLPVIANKVGGVPSFVENGKDGILVEPNDEKELLRAFKYLMDNRERRQALAQAGQKKARGNYDWDKITEQLITIYKEVVD